MQTQLADFFKNDPDHDLAETILKKCVHCGFCTATCPTYQVLGSELDSPRGRIYLIKEMLEGETATDKTLTHLDRCLTCRSCETTCPSGVEYSKLLDIGRRVAETQVERPFSEKALRNTLLFLLPKPRLFGFMAFWGRLVRPALPKAMQKKLPPKQAVKKVKPTTKSGPKAIVHEGCVQPGLAQQINEASVYLLDKLGYQVSRVRQCCGAVEHHLNAHDAAHHTMTKLVKSTTLEEGTLFVSNASGCGAQLKDLGHIMRHDAAMADSAQTLSNATVDIVEVLRKHKDRLCIKADYQSQKVAVHTPCTLQHAQKLHGEVDAVLRELGLVLTVVQEAHLCCGSAGTYSVLQADTSQQLKQRKMNALSSGNPDMIVTANIGCLTHLQEDSSIPLLHWIELIDIKHES